MRFNSEAYAKVFPRKEAPEKVETVVETFRPSTEPVGESSTPDPEGTGDDDGHGDTGEPDSE